MSVNSVSKFLHHHPVLEYAADLKEICKPIQGLDLVYFSHAHIDANFKMSAIALNPDFFNLYFQKNYHQFDLHMHNSVTQEQYVIWDNIGLSNNSMAMHKDFMQFNQAHTFSIVFNNKNNTRDYYHFAAKLGQESMNGVYLQKIDILKKFILYFHDQISKHKHLKAAYSKKISINKKIGGYFHENTIPTSTDGKLKLTRLRIPGTNTYLTIQELQCLNYLSAGMTQEAIAKTLDITLRTIKAHIINIKQKLGCTNQFQLGVEYNRLLGFM